MAITHLRSAKVAVRSAKVAAVLSAVLAAGLAGCTYERNGPVSGHFVDFNTNAPTKTSVTVCHAYGCKMQTKVRMTSADLAEIKSLMAKSAKGDNAAEERRAVAYAVGWFERHVGPITGTSGDRAGMELNGPGDRTQQDCVDEATNTTSYMLYLEQNGLLKYHKVGTPFSKGNVLIGGIANWPHWTGVLLENSNGQKWAVDSWIYANGENPAVVEAENWYIKDLGSLPKPTT